MDRDLIVVFASYAYYALMLIGIVFSMAFLSSGESGTRRSFKKFAIVCFSMAVITVFAPWVIAGVIYAIKFAFNSRTLAEDFLYSFI